MSRIAERSCECCGEPEGTRCVKGFTCNCGGYDGGLADWPGVTVTVCMECGRCKTHCRCKKGFLSPARSIAQKKAQLGI